jgi:hypothetical protein
MGRLLALVSGLLGLCSSVLAASASAGIGAEIVVPATVRSAGVVALGGLSAGPSGGLVVLSPDGTRTVRGDLVARGGDVRAACLRVSGPAGASYAVVVPRTVYLRCPTHGAPVVADSFVVSCGSAGLPAGGADVVYIGLTVHIAPNQAPGAYCADLEVQVCYQ